MAGENRTKINTVRDRLLAEGHAFSFYQAVSLLERALAESPRVGTLGPVEKERIRFAGTPSLSFAASDISGIEFAERKPVDGAWIPPAIQNDGEPAEDTDKDTLYRLRVTFMGLYGPPSPLPPAVTEAIVRSDEPNIELADFLDVFNHRFVSLLYRVWKKYRYYIQFDQKGDDPFSRVVFAVLGLDREAAEARFDIRWIRLMPYAGMLGLYCHSAPMLAGLLNQYFDGTPVEIEEFCERVVTIAPEQRSRLGSATARMGQSFTLGRHVHDVSGKFRIWMGPVDFATYSRFLPNGNWFAELRNLVRIALRDQLDFDLGIVIEPDQVPRCTLGKNSRSRLGWSAWLGQAHKDRVKVVRDMHLKDAA